MICTLRVKNRYVIRRKSKKTCICMKNLARFAEHPTSKDNIKRLIWQAPRHLKFHILLRQMTLVLIYGVFQFNEANVKALEIHSGLFKSLLLTTLSSFLMEWFNYCLFFGILTSKQMALSSFFVFPSRIQNTIPWNMKTLWNNSIKSDVRHLSEVKEKTVTIR